jgi:hypothetical protein
VWCTVGLGRLGRLGCQMHQCRDCSLHPLWVQEMRFQAP